MTMEIKQSGRAWQRMLSGRRLDLLNPAPQDVEIEDIAHGLARVARWNGQTVGAHAFSVAQHSLLVEEIFGTLKPESSVESRLQALLHDAAEYVVGDLISPFKAAIGVDYKAFENRLMSAILERFALPRPPETEVAAIVKRADRIAAFSEATALAGFGYDEACLYFEEPKDLPIMIRKRLRGLIAIPAQDAQSAFLARFRHLYEA